ncbi:hypothetical protein [Actinokineospora bangkokensis]|uniref:Uncharacterized protein n=1 Tax=Actinokineospora bangkokensis TaxID=1193682 RepID=A0A1Q9LSR7_9PSEU|nr:hypothetical protein [Actinokineospora bangkokensis]OLR95053.1 hypothetical protein BJP25_08870 [Actinokineospora bangkokensis]
MTSGLPRFTAAFRAIGENIRLRRTAFWTGSVRWDSFKRTASFYEDRQLLGVGWSQVDNPAQTDEVMKHLHAHLPEWNGFRQRVFTYVQAEFDPIYGDLRVAEGARVYTEAEPLGQREYLEQIFEACPEGSYGYYAKSGLAPFKAVVGNFAAATIDQFFASQVHFLKQPMSPQVNDIMSTMETKYWDTREEAIDFIAGKVLGKAGRELGVATPQFLAELWRGKRVPDLPEGETLDQDQLAAIAGQLNDKITDLDLQAATAFAKSLYDQMTADNRLRVKE